MEVSPAPSLFDFGPDPSGPRPGYGLGPALGTRPVAVEDVPKAVSKASFNAADTAVTGTADAAALHESHLALHPALWHAHQLARPGGQVRRSHFDALDAVLPGGGWPTQALTELLLPHPGLGELRLLAPVLAAVQGGGQGGGQGSGQGVMWFNPPAAPCAWALGALGIDVAQLVVVQPCQAAQAVQALGRPRRGDVLRGATRPRLPAADMLWALEQALKSGHVGAVVAWLPARLPADTLRRLQLAAQAHDGPAFLLREVAAQQHASAAPLRLLLAAAGPDVLRVAVLKRRGPPLAQPLLLALPPVLSRAGMARSKALMQRGMAVSPPVPTSHLVLAPTVAIGVSMTAAISPAKQAS